MFSILFIASLSGIVEPNFNRPSTSGAFNKPRDFALVTAKPRAAFTAYRAAVLASDATPEQKEAAIMARLKSIRAQILAEREKSWKLYFRWVSKSNSVSTAGGYAGSATSKPKCQARPDPRMTTSANQTVYYRLSGIGWNWKDMDALKGGTWHKGNKETTPNVKVVCTPYMKRSSKGKTLIRSFAVFRYPASVAKKIATDEADRFLTTL